MPPLSHRDRRTAYRRVVPWVLAGVVSVLALGCGSKSGEGRLKPGRSAPRPIVRGLDGSVGRIESIRTDLRLVVLDYSLSILPQHGELLSVWRDGIEVGQVRVTGPARPGTGKIGGEYISGDVRMGDTVRSKAP